MRRLLDAGAEVFARRGYHSARVDDIVKTAKTSHGTFYLYFANKEELFQALAMEVAEQMTGLAESLGRLTPDEAGYRELRDWLSRFSEIYDQCSPVISAWTEAETDTSEVGRIGADLLGGFAVTLAERIRASQVDDLHAGVASIAIVAMVERFHYYAHSGVVQADRDAVLDTLARVTHAGLFGHGHLAEAGNARAANG